MLLVNLALFFFHRELFVAVKRNCLRNSSGVFVHVFDISWVYVEWLGTLGSSFHVAAVVNGRKGTSILTTPSEKLDLRGREVIVGSRTSDTTASENSQHIILHAPLTNHPRRPHVS